jgi:hypothetical protein
MKVQSYRHPVTTALATALATLALAAPAAPARPVEQFLGTHSSPSACDHSPASHPAPNCNAQALPRPSAAPTGDVSPASPARDLSTDAGFSWGAAAIGAGTALGLLALASMAAIALSGRARIRTAR